MSKIIQMGSKNILEGTTGLAKRKLESWIESFTKETEGTECPEILRKWIGISTIAAVLEQKVWMHTSSRLYPNLYIMVLGHPGVGKTKAIREARNLVREIPEFQLAPISMTWASLTDAIDDAKKIINKPSTGEIRYNSMFICAQELGTFIHKYDHEMVDGLAAFYDPDHYTQTRRTSGKKIDIKSPQINLLVGSTPQNLSDLMPDKAWGQGFMSRVIMAFSDERIIGNDFAEKSKPNTTELMLDLNVINELYGQFNVTQSYQDVVNEWRQQGQPPTPGHPKLVHYNSRRKANLYKLSMIYAIDKGNALVLTEEHFWKALDWLTEVEKQMPEVFKAGVANADGLAMDEILHFITIADRGHGVAETAINRFAQKLIPSHSVLRVIEIMTKSGQIKHLGRDKVTGIDYYKRST